MMHAVFEFIRPAEYFTKPLHLNVFMLISNVHIRAHIRGTVYTQ